MSKQKHDDLIEDLTDDIQPHAGSQTVSQEEFEKLQAEFDGLKDLAGQLEGQLKRAVADYQNLEKRIADGKT